MSFQTTLGISWVSPTGQISSTIAATGSQTQDADVPIPASSTNYEIDIDIPSTPELKAFLFQADAAMTIKTNSTGSPDNTITLAANVPYFWITGNGTNPLNAAITKLYVTTTPGGTLKIRSLFNTVPNNV